MLMMPEPLSTVGVDVVTPSKNPERVITTNISSPTMDQHSLYRPITPPLVMARASSKQSSTTRDSSWLELEPCMDYLRADGQSCPRGDVCPFAHPPKGTLSEAGKVTCCYDFLKDRCHREHCKYFHPPPHIKDRLVAAGKQFGAMMSGFYSVPQPALHVPTGMPQMGLLASPPPFQPSKVHICPDYLTGQCHLQLCHLAHPEHYVRRSPDGTVTICRDYIRSTGCPREQCRFYHPPPHILESCSLSQPPTGFVTPQGVLLLPGFQQPAAPMFYQPSSAGPATANTPTSTFMYFPGSFPSVSGMSPHMYVPVSYPSLVPSLPLTPFPYQSVSTTTSNGVESASPPPLSANPAHSQTIVSVQTIQ